MTVKSLIDIGCIKRKYIIRDIQKILDGEPAGRVEAIRKFTFKSIVLKLKYRSRCRVSKLACAVAISMVGTGYVLPIRIQDVMFHVEQSLKNLISADAEDSSP